MITISRHGVLGPIEALELRDELARAAHRSHRDVTLDLTDVSSLHPAVSAAIVHGAAKVRRQTGSFRLLQPAITDARRTLQLASIVRLIR